MEFHLVGVGFVGGVGEEVAELGGGEVRDSDVAGEAFGVEESHGGPGGEVLDSVFVEEGLGDGPVHVVEVEVGEAEAGVGRESVVWGRGCG